MSKFPSLEITNLYKPLSFSNFSVEEFFSRIFSLHRHNSSGLLSIAFLSRSSHSKIHGKFLNDFRPTDVITFPADIMEGSAGEICVSVEQAIDESKKRNVSLAEELSLYLIHGWLHLVGFDDKELVDRTIMRREESKAMELIRQEHAWPDFLLAPLHNHY